MLKIRSAAERAKYEVERVGYLIVPANASHHDDRLNKNDKQQLFEQKVKVKQPLSFLEHWTRPAKVLFRSEGLKHQEILLRHS